MMRRNTGVQGEYFSIPRGRVLYRFRDSRFIVLCGREVARNPHAIRTIASEFCLAENAFLVEQDLHYCLLSDEELNVEFEEAPN